MSEYDVTILTTKEFVDPPVVNNYIQNVLTEDGLVQQALEAQGMKVTRTYWDNPNFDWSATRTVLFRTVWDYFERFDEFQPWLSQVSKQTIAINPIELIYWNIDKHYLGDLQKQDIPIVPTIFVEPGDQRPLKAIIKSTSWKHVVLKPAISGAARHTYHFRREDTVDYEEIFNRLITSESLLIQPFMHQVMSKGEVSHMVFNGKYSHSILKKAKKGDFRVQDDFGGSVHQYEATHEEKDFAEAVFAKCPVPPLYGRVDVVWDNNDQLAVAELELIEPELWFRFKPEAASRLAAHFEHYLKEICTFK